MARTWKTIVIHRLMDAEIDRCAEHYLRGRLLDIGCGTKPYASRLSKYVDEHIGVDREIPFNPAASVDLVGSAYEIPTPDESFDSALCTAALEHLAEPEDALKECLRILKPGGVAVYTVPFFWHIHAAPWDYYRFTKYGLRHLFEKAGFEILEIKPLSGFWVTSATMFCYYIERFHRGPLRLFPVVPAIGVLVQWIAYGLWKLDHAEDWTWMYSVVARKIALAAQQRSTPENDLPQARRPELSSKS
ncbi:MAG: class I SAM-dependent methyltransferase [Burkholderiales bacterium]